MQGIIQKRLSLEMNMFIAGVVCAFMVEMNTLALETNAFSTGDERLSTGVERFSTGDERIENPCLNFSHTHSLL